jgi:hypothetical protein
MPEGRRNVKRPTRRRLEDAGIIYDSSKRIDKTKGK